MKHASAVAIEDLTSLSNQRQEEIDALRERIQVDNVVRLQLEEGLKAQEAELDALKAGNTALANKVSDVSLNGECIGAHEAHSKHGICAKKSALSSHLTSSAGTQLPRARR